MKIVNKKFGNIENKLYITKMVIEKHMKQNLAHQIENEIDLLVQTFINIGWDCEDGRFLSKKMEFITNPTAKNQEWKYKVSMVPYAKLLAYTEEGIDMLVPWIYFRIEIDDDELAQYPDAIKRVQQVAEFIKGEIPGTGYKPFYDEDAFRGNFTRPERRENSKSVEFGFYLNIDYPDGFWENHTL